MAGAGPPPPMEHPHLRHFTRSDIHAAFDFFASSHEHRRERLIATLTPPSVVCYNVAVYIGRYVPWKAAAYDVPRGAINCDLWARPTSLDPRCVSMHSAMHLTTPCQLVLAAVYASDTVSVLRLRPWTSLTDQELSTVALFRHLKTVDLFNCGVSSAGLAAFIEKTPPLYVTGTATDSRTSKISPSARRAPMTPDLVTFDLTFAKICDADVALIGPTMPALTSLTLDYVPVTDVGIAALCRSARTLRPLASHAGANYADPHLLSDRASSIVRLSLSWTKVSDAGLLDIARSLKALQEIRLDTCLRVTDAGVQHLVYCGLTDDGDFGPSEEDDPEPPMAPPQTPPSPLWASVVQQGPDTERPQPQPPRQVTVCRKPPHITSTLRCVSLRGNVDRLTHRTAEYLSHLPSLVSVRCAVRWHGTRRDIATVAELAACTALLTSPSLSVT